MYNGNTVKLLGANNEPTFPEWDTILYELKISQTAFTNASRASATDECSDLSTARRIKM